MIHLTKNNAVPFLRERLERLILVTHLQGDSYDRDLTMIMGKRKRPLEDNAFFMTLDEYKEHIIIRRKWNYEGGKIVAKNVFNTFEDDDNEPFSEKGILRAINEIIHFLNLTTKLKVVKIEDILLDSVFYTLNRVEQSLKVRKN